MPVAKGRVLSFASRSPPHQHNAELSGVKAKRARAAADVRTKATHAQWDEFELDDVRSTIEFTRDLIETKLT